MRVFEHSPSTGQTVDHGDARARHRRSTRAAWWCCATAGSATDDRRENFVKKLSEK